MSNNGIRGADWFVLWFGGRAWCLRSLQCACTLALLLLWGSAFPCPMTRLATVVALAFAMLLATLQAGSGQGFIW